MDNPEPGQRKMGKNLREHTRRRREDIGNPEKVAALVQQVLGYISDVGLDLAIFLDAVFWGNDHWNPLVVEISSNWQISAKEAGGSVADVARNGMLGATNERSLFTSKYTVRNLLPHCVMQ
jgi:hypothetical protein